MDLAAFAQFGSPDFSAIVTGNDIRSLVYGFIGGDCTLHDNDTTDMGSFSLVSKAISHYKTKCCPGVWYMVYMRDCPFRNMVC